VFGQRGTYFADNGIRYEQQSEREMEREREIKRERESERERERSFFLSFSSVTGT
jgi:hypothetical protein